MKFLKTAGIALLAGLVTTLTAVSGANASTITETSRLHYTRANALVKSGNHREAVHHYKQAYRLNPSGRVGQYSKIALAHYGVSPVQETNPVTTNTILTQAREWKKRSAQTTRARIDSRSRNIEGKIRDIESNERATIQNIRNNPSYKTVFVPHYNGFYPYGFRNTGSFVRVVDQAATQARIDSVREQVAARKKRIREVTLAKENQLKDDHFKHSEMILETASNLQSQMVGRGTKLDPQRSNLYIRSYR